MFLVPLNRPTSLARSLDRLFDERFFDAVAAPRGPALDVSEDDKTYTVKLDVPGVAKEDLQVSIEGRRVSVQAETKSAEEQKDGARAVYRERRAQSFARTFTLPVELSSVDATAKLENGVLTLVVPKLAARTAARIAVN